MRYRPICAIDRSGFAINGSVIRATIDRSLCAIGRWMWGQFPEKLQFLEPKTGPRRALSLGGKGSAGKANRQRSDQNLD